MIGANVSLWAIVKLLLKPIYEPDAEKAYREFFTQEFRTEQLGQPGRWFLWKTRQPGLHNPVQLSQFEELLGKSHGDGTSREPVGWRLNFEVGRDTTTLWALSEKPTRESIEWQHRWAVTNALGALMRRVSEHGESFPEKTPGAAVALFQSGTGMGQIPYLHTTAFLFNTAFLPNGGVARFSAESVEKAEDLLDWNYRLQLGINLNQAIGGVGTSQATDVPRRLFCPLFDPSLGRGEERGRFAEYGGPFRGEQLFVQWRRQAEARGFGPAQAEAVIRHAREAEPILRAAGEARSWHGLAAKVGDWIHRGSQALRKSRSVLEPLDLKVEKSSSSTHAHPSKDHDMTHSH